MFVSIRYYLSVIAATLLTFSLISSTPQAFAGTVPEGQSFGVATCCGSVITILNGGEHEVGEDLNLQAFVDFNPFQPNNWILNLGDSTEIIGILASGNFLEFEDGTLSDEGRTFIIDILTEYGFSDPTLYVSYLMNQPVAEYYAGGIFTFGPTVPELIAAPAVFVRQSANLSFAQSLFASDTLSDPDGQLRKTVDQIMAKHGSLIK